MSARRGGGSYRERRVENILDCPYNCDGQMSLKVLARAPGGSIFRCTKKRDHTKSSRTYSFFDKSNLMLQDIMVFIKSYLEKSSLAQCARFSGMAYGTTAVNWASFTRELFKEYFYTNLRYRKMQGVVEIDESLFGRRVKFHRGNPNCGLKIWIFGMVERDSNTLVMYPVSDRTEDTLLPIIERHVEKGSTIYSDGWSAYCKLNDAGYDHFTVLHKYSFKKTYINTKSQEVVEVLTNRIEGAWKHAKDHFRRLVGTKLSQFEGHLTEIMWRSAERGNIYEAFFNLLRSVYPLDSPPHYTYPTPLFNTWEGIPESQSKIDDWEIRPENTDAESEAESQIETTSAELFSGLVEEDSSAIMPNRELSSSELQERQLSTLDKVLQEMLEGSGSEDEGDTTLTELTVP
ncbi:uncharacterized protein LOC133195646 [Saccostrea echinata]|uniref:uncharacterized protein LOC133195646 n=1 Tax=Saccostrea echinata TaxID=191078 RepID=UPI002A83FDD5|nr:uncharacterized protein LOC133195646 [Saccostrea echinata]